MAWMLSLGWTFVIPWTVVHPTGSSVQGIFQARILEWVAISPSMESSQFRDWTHISCISWIGRFFTAGPPGKHQFSSTTQSFPTLCDPMNHSTPGLPVHHKLLEFTQTHTHRVGDAIHPSHPLLSPSPPAPNPSQHQGLFQRVISSHEVTKVLEFQPQHQFFQWTPRTYLLQDGLVGSPCSPKDSQESSPIPQFKSINFQCSAFFTVQLSHPYMTTGKTIALTRRTFVGKVMSLFLICSLGWS